MISRAKWMGGGKHRTFVGSTTLNYREARCYSLACTSGAGDVVLPDARFVPSGGPIFIIWNLGPTSPLAIKTNTGVTIAPVFTGQVVELWLNDNSTQDGVWAGRLRGVGTGSGAIPQQRLFVPGGAGATTSLSVYTPATNTWAAGSAMPNPHTEGAAMKIGGRVNVLGDFPLTAASLKNDELTAATGTWVNRAAVPFQAGRTVALGSERRGFGEVYGGDGSTNVQRYTPFGTWASMSGLPIAKARCSGAAIDGLDRVILIAGDPVPTPNLARNVMNDTYWTIANLPTAFRHSISCFAINGKVYACGGRSEGPPITRYQNVDEYDPITDTWVSRSALSVGARWNGAGIGGNSRGYYCAGQDNADAVSNLCITYQQDTWSSIANINVARSLILNHGSAMV